MRAMQRWGQVLCILLAAFNIAVMLYSALPEKEKRTHASGADLVPPPETRTLRNRPETEHRSPQYADLSSPQVGVCITGGVRTFSVVADSILENVVNAVQPNASRRVVIFNLQTKSDCGANPANTAESVRQCEQHLAAGAEMVANGSIAAAFSATVTVDNELTCSHPFAKRQSACCRKRPQALADKPQGGLWSYAQYVRRRLCIEQLKAAETARGVPFDYIVLLRPDMYVFEPVPPASFLVRRGPQVLAASKEGGQPPGDYLYMLTRDLLDDFDRVLYECFDSFCETDGWQHIGGPPEFKIMEFIDKHHIPFQVYPFKFAITRSRTAADCARLRNEVHRVATVRGEGKQAISPYDLCTRLFPTS
jgi:hypothetical protein